MNGADDEAARHAFEGNEKASGFGADQDGCDAVDGQGDGGGAASDDYDENDPLYDLVERTKSDQGLPFTTEVRAALGMKRRDDPAGYETLRSALKKAGLRVTVLEKLLDEDNAGFPRPRHKPSQGNTARPVTRNDFYAYMVMHRYIFAPTGEMWPAASVNARLLPVDVGEGETVKATLWLDQNRPVEQMTWMPGEPVLIRDRLIILGGWLERAGVTVFNLYKPPRQLPGDAALAGKWLDHVKRVFPDDWEHIVSWLAHRVQRPQEKINHALVLSGAQGIGKDTVLEPVRHAVGPWNFADVSPTMLIGRFNGFIKSVILRVNEARDLGEVNRYAFYEHCKPLTASPPELLRCDEKNLREYNVPNIMGVIITSNHKTAGIYLPPDDRRHYVAWSPLKKGELERQNKEYFTDIHKWLESEGNGHVAAYLLEFDLSGFDAKAPPPQTDAWREIVEANQGSEEGDLGELLAILTRNGKPRPAVTLEQCSLLAPPTLSVWLNDPKNRRIIPDRLGKIGYVRVYKPGVVEGRWKIGGKDKAVYARHDLSKQQQVDAAYELEREGRNRA